MTIKRLQLLACCHRPLFEKLHDRMLDHYIHLSALLHCSALRLISIFFKRLPTMASADFSQFVVTTANETACETSRDNAHVR